MCRFSIIIPVYNTGEYLKKCLDSVFEQDFDDYEVIIVNDGSTDNSEKIINDYLKKYSNIIYLNQKNSGLSMARNNGVLKATGEYLLFLDSDDFYEKNILRNLNREIDDDYDVVRFQIQDVFPDGRVVKYSDLVFSGLNGFDSFKLLCLNHYVEVAWAYCYRREYWIENNYKYLDGTYHEDFGLTPLVLINSNLTKSIDVFGYNYFKRESSITNGGNYDKIKKQADDFLIHFKFLKSEGSKISGDLSVFYSYIANSVLIKATTLKGKDYKKYIKELKRINAFDMLLDDSIGRKIKKILIKFSPKIYYRIVGK